MTRKTLLLAVVVLFATSCVFRVRQPGPPPGDLPRQVSRDEAAAIAARVAFDRGYGAHVRDVDSEGPRWEVEMDITRADGRGKMKVDVDKSSGAVLDVKEKFHEKKHDDDDDDDDGHHGKGNGHEKGKGKGHDKHDDDDDDD